MNENLIQNIKTMKNLKQVLAFVLILTVFFACNEKVSKTTFVMNGTLEGITEGKVELSSASEDVAFQEVVDIKDGKFTFTGDYDSPVMAYVRVIGIDRDVKVYVENVVMTFNGDVKDLRHATVTGGPAQEDLNLYNSQLKVIEEKFMAEIAELKDPKTSKERRTELIQTTSLRRYSEVEALDNKFIEEKPESFHAGILVGNKIVRKTPIEAEKILQALDPKVQANPEVVKLIAKVQKMKAIEKTIDEIVVNASNVSYKVDTDYKGVSTKDIIYLGVFTNNNICALHKDGTVYVIDPKGGVVNSFKSESKGTSSSIAVDKANQIYVLSTIEKEITKKVRGKVHKIKEPQGVECIIYDEKGTVLNQYHLSTLKNATGARVSDETLIVGDYRNKRIVMFDCKTGKEEASIDGMRPCCSILDFSINDKKEILVANLGAFRVQGFDFTGKKLVSFGRRGKALDEFHGCCNPVSVNTLSNGAIVTVEKDPTRIKIYSKEGAKEIAGIDELVKGCLHIPMIVDANDNLYLASRKKGIVKCVSVN